MLFSTEDVTTYSVVLLVRGWFVMILELADHILKGDNE